MKPLTLNRLQSRRYRDQVKKDADMCQVVRYTGRIGPSIALCLALSVTSPNAFAQTAATEPDAEEIESAVALEGYCPVCVVEMRKWVRGKAEHRFEYDGRIYFFPSSDQLEQFTSDPAKYVPALGGDCSVCFAKMGERTPGNIRFSALRRGRLYLFPAEEQKKEFLSNPTDYENVDLAFNGACAVCRVEMGKDVPGRPDVAAYFRGIRYLFPGPDQREMFLKDPEKYAVRSTIERQASTESRRRLVRFRGKTSCAGCEFGVAPLGAPQELGLAVEVDGNHVCVIEDSHELYADLYERRFDRVRVEVVGRIIKRDGRFFWIKPTSLRERS